MGWTGLQVRVKMAAGIQYDIHKNWLIIHWVSGWEESQGLINSW